MSREQVEVEGPKVERPRARPGPAFPPSTTSISFSTMRAYYFDDIPSVLFALPLFPCLLLTQSPLSTERGDQRLAHDSGEDVTPERLVELGLVYFRIPVEEGWESEIGGSCWNDWDGRLQRSARRWTLPQPTLSLFQKEEGGNVCCPSGWLGSACSP